MSSMRHGAAPASTPMRRTLAITICLALAALAAGSPVAAQAEASPSPAPTASPTPSGGPTTPETDTLAFERPQWKRITPARSPAAREDHTWTVDAERRFAYLFGGRDGSKDFDDLRRFDLEQDSWMKLSPAGATPEARFGHSAVWVDGLGLVVFAGQKGVEFFGDLWVFDPDRTSGGRPRQRGRPQASLWVLHDRRP